MASISTAQHGTPAYWSGLYAKGEDFHLLTDVEVGLLAALAPAPGARALDLACGTGAATRQLGQLGFVARGLDFSEVAIERARAQTPEGAGVEFVCADLADVPDLEEPGSLALVICRLAAAFLDGALLVDRVSRWLAPGGVFMVVVPDPANLDLTRRRIYLDESQLANLTAGWRTVERHQAGRLLVLLMRDWAPTHAAAEKRNPAPNALFGVGITVQHPETGHILLGRSARFHGLLEAPGGKPEIRIMVEDLRATAARELYEETELEADPADFQLRGLLLDERSGVPRVTVAAYIDRFAGSPRVTEPDLISSWDWYPVEGQLPGELFKPSLDVLAACLPGRFHGDRPARYYPLHLSFTELPAAPVPRSTEVPGTPNAAATATPHGRAGNA